MQDLSIGAHRMGRQLAARVIDNSGSVLGRQGGA